MANRKAKIIKLPNSEPIFDLQPHDIDALADALASFGKTSKIMARMATTSPRGKKGLKLNYQFKIKLRGISNPPVWRRVLVPANFTFSGFHAVIQEAFGWWNEHLYCFGDKPYSQSLYIAEEDEEDWYRPDYDARKFTLEELFGDGGIVKKFCYVYDFGDDWIHDITLEKVFDEYSDHATCIKGKGACPEEDSGGVWEYEDMKEDGEIEVSAVIDLVEINKHVEAVKPTGFEPW
ncbi:MAG: plasmid pRiA4b ORF-3 family protein [Prevotella sp.]|nr:plasmid pRiA4b ORF-3 family protein [Prevotellaceae bacterium]MDY5844633.1 plasmid pRiA4b ORF-3 family protein [Prevotella sp.]